MSGLIVKAPLVTATQNGRVLYLYGGDVVPDGVDDASVKHLKSLGYVEDGDPAPIGAEPQEVERPAESGPGSAKERWIAYAEAKGVTVSGDASKDDIIAAVAAAGF